MSESILIFQKEGLFLLFTVKKIIFLELLEVLLAFVVEVFLCAIRSVKQGNEGLLGSGEVDECLICGESDVFVMG